MPKVEPWRKRVMQFQSSVLAGREQSERHYLDVHSAWALREIRKMDDMLAYHTNLVLGQWDLLGAFHQAPDLWRIATMRTRPEGNSGFPPSVIPFLSADHLNFLRELRGFEVEEATWFDRRSGQVTSDKYVLLLDRPEGLEHAEALAAVERVESGLAELLERAYGARLMSSNRVISESEYDDLREPGQGITSRKVAQSERLAFIDVYFDHQEWGEEFFAQDEVRQLFVDAAFAPGHVAGYHALERAGHDKR